MKDNRPLVSVNVLMYNSSRYIIETLESIKSQTYQNIELIMSDDKSTDNTVQICEDWISRNKDRFVSYKILVPEHNTGQSGNYNRAFRAATGEWIKEIDGDDLLMPDCIEEYTTFIQINPDAKWVFGKFKAFGASEARCREVEQCFDYSLFSKSIDEQFEYAITAGNFFPSGTLFYNRLDAIKHNIINDERIPMIEDFPKWINCLKIGIQFHLMDKVTIRYRLGGVSTSECSPRLFTSKALLDYYYIYPALFRLDPNLALNKYTQELCQLYNRYYAVKHSYAFRIGKIIMSPIMALIHLFRKIVSFLFL